MILGLGASVFAVVSLTHLARTSREQRTVRAREHVEAELDRLAELAPSLSRTQRARKGRRGSGEIRSGYFEPGGPVGAENPRMGEVLDAATTASEAVVTEVRTADDGLLVLGALRLESGSIAWASQRVVIGPEMASLRVAVTCLALLMFVMVAASVQTLVTFDRGAGALRESVVLLAGDLHATIKRPKLLELKEVADGLDSLARELLRAQEEKVRLMRKLLEHERWASLGRVVAGVAHEVRNPLAAIKLRTDLAEGMPDIPTPLREDLALIGSEVTRLDRLVRDLLLLADKKPEARIKTRTSLGELVLSRTALLRPWAKERGVTITATGNAELALDVDGVTRAIDNLIRNAVEASPPDGVVEAEVKDEAGSVGVTITDAGEGVKPENEAMVFEPFFTTKSSGTGLGLALARAVAEAHGGSLEHARKSSRTQFTLVLGKA